MTKQMVLKVDEVLEVLNNWIVTCDDNELAKAVGDIFGGECKYLDGEFSDIRFTFIPNKNYGGAFDK